MVRLYVQGLSSYRVLATLLTQRLGRPVSRFTLNGWVHRLGEAAKTPLEVSAELAPCWGGFLGIDGKAVWVAGKEHALLIAVDATTQDIVHAGFQTTQSAESFSRLLIGCYRFKRFTDSCRRANNGKAPLEIAGVDLDNRDWLSFLIAR